ncbi:DUF1836 domain-containing protein [Clostridium botulinum]|uniref:DUF1836 domain-containing protein n=1 Tax=Clostridium botulinum (strain Eklund 17B / Type B) TaxID=935198 RepID=B2TQZ3_CLOBB|nr:MULTISPECIES: DUF1836 domain-containing protein [Clostridium]ACD22488.1 conserved hypothetical protein [Clostridium botulinum B str. Eklund 17B (NRP)]AIY79361.1 hypothetical protein U728_2294 [Clostridium botulinum 202F]KAI3347387.1 DUF1836 domain-containing protein [Clostridium botulinum]KFX57494.1 hypothetical protein KU41_09210 [Clostridium botulinum]KFX59816.1 hypothetical protein KU40_02160 [Clostridium botulinum]
MNDHMESSYIKEIVEKISENSLISYEDLPKYDLFLSQVIDYLNDKFMDENFTNNIVQNYIKSEVITKPEDGKKRGYTKIHLIQLVLLSYMRPVLTTEEIKKVFSLAFNEINERDDDIIGWQDAYKIFSEIQDESLNEYLKASLENEKKLKERVKCLNLKDSEEEERITVFLLVLSLIAEASVIKKLVQKIVKEYHAH